MNPDDPEVYTLPEVVVWGDKPNETDRPNRLMFGRMRDAIKAWQERNLYNQEYSGASDYIGAGLGLLGSELARAATNVASLGEYAVREIIPSGITGRPARRYSAYESNPASYALAEAALDVAPIPVVDDVARAIGATRRTATRRAARNVSDQIVRGATGDTRSYRYVDPRDEAWNAGPRSIIGQMDRADRELFLKEVMDESSENWRRYYEQFPDREKRIADLYVSGGVDRNVANILARRQAFEQMNPTPNLMIYDYPLSGSQQLGELVFMPRLREYLLDLANDGLLPNSTARDEITEMARLTDARGEVANWGVAGFYDTGLDYGVSFPDRTSVLHEAVHGMQGKLGREMVDEGLGSIPLTQAQRDYRRSLSAAQRKAQDRADSRSGDVSTNSTDAYESTVGTMMRRKQRDIKNSIPWYTEPYDSVIYNLWKNNEDKIRKELGLSSDRFNAMLSDFKKAGAEQYYKDPMEIGARVGGEFAEKILRDKAKFDFLKDIDPYKLPKYKDLSQEQKDYMFDNFFSRQKMWAPTSSWRGKGEIDVNAMDMEQTPVGDEILSGFYNMAIPRRMAVRGWRSVPMHLDYKDVLTKPITWELFRHATKAIPAVAAGTTAAGYGVSLGNDQ